MRVREEIKGLLHGGMVNQVTISEERKHKDSPIHDCISIPLAENKKTMCAFCKKTNTNYCWNCEKAHCDDHAYLVFNKGFMNTFCTECYKDLITGMDTKK